MTNPLMRTTPEGGQLPGEPSVDALLKSVMGEGWSGLRNTEAGKHLQENADSAQNEIKREFCALFLGSALGRKVLDQILDQTLRRAPYMPQAPGKGVLPTLEQQAVYGLERQGQNGLAIFICAMIVQGENLPPRGSSPKPKKKG